MEDVTIDKAELIARLRANRETHRGIFLEALEGYRASLLEILENHVKLLENGKLPKTQHIRIDPPADYTRDYDRVISMLEMDKGTDFTLSETDFAQYVLDDWAWKRQWSIENSGYVSGNTRAAHVDYFEAE